MATTIAAHTLVCSPDDVRRDVWVHVGADGTVEAITAPEPGSTPDVRASIVAPGLVDIHTHGLGGAEDVAQSFLDVQHTARQLPRHGVTAFLPTLVCSSPEELAALAAAVRPHVGAVAPGAAAMVAGINVEGPLVADLGGLPASNVDMDAAAFAALLDDVLLPAGLRVMTISPSVEAPRGYDRLRLLLERGVRPSLGHDLRATEADVLGALRLAAEPMHVTHIFNVSRFHHREPGLANVGCVSRFPRLPRYEGLVEPTVEVIADGAHVHPLALATLLAAKRHSHIACVSDSMLPPEPGLELRYGAERVLRVADDASHVTVASAGKSVMAGSCATLIHALRRLVHELGVDLAAAVGMCSTVPARVAGISDSAGEIRVGRRADLLLLSEALEVEGVWVGGGAYRL